MRQVAKNHFFPPGAGCGILVPMTMRVFLDWDGPFLPKAREFM
jgi:hypothetical protein